MGYLEEKAPAGGIQRREQGSADKGATLVVALGFALTFAAIVGLPGPDLWFMGAAPALAIACGLPALLSVLMEKFRGGVSRALLILGAAALASVGVIYLGKADIARVVLAYFIPSALFAGAAMILAAPRLRARAT